MLEYKIQPITLPMPFHLGRVNVFLLSTASGCLLIDTGPSSARKEFLAELEKLGCTGETLKLVLLTHGDFDHSGNAAALRSRFGTRIAMHLEDRLMAEQGDMFASRKKPNFILKAIFRLFSGFGKNEQFTPDIFVKDGADLTDFGLEARVLALPGHSQGSIGLLTVNGDLFCGDLFENTKGPALNSLMDDRAAAAASLEALKSRRVKIVYPGHGQPFAWDVLVSRISGAA